LSLQTEYKRNKQGMQDEEDLIDEEEDEKK